MTVYIVSEKVRKQIGKFWDIIPASRANLYREPVYGVRKFEFRTLRVYEGYRFVNINPIIWNSKEATVDFGYGCSGGYLLLSHLVDELGLTLYAYNSYCNFDELKYIANLFRDTPKTAMKLFTISLYLQALNGYINENIEQIYGYEDKYDIIRKIHDRFSSYKLDIKIFKKYGLYILFLPFCHSDPNIVSFIIEPDKDIEIYYYTVYGSELRDYWIIRVNELTDVYRNNVCYSTPFSLCLWFDIRILNRKVFEINKRNIFSMLLYLIYDFNFDDINQLINDITTFLKSPVLSDKYRQVFHRVKRFIKLDRHHYIRLIKQYNESYYL